MYKPSPLFLEILKDARRAGHQLSPLEKEILKRGEPSDKEEVNHPDEEVVT